MTYGVDQCRMCGAKIQPRDNKAAIQWEEAKRRPPTMPEVEWRRLGFLAMPTKAQIMRPVLGLCQPCGFRVSQRRHKPFIRLFILLAVIISFLGGALTLAFVVPH